MRCRRGARRAWDQIQRFDAATLPNGLRVKRGEGRPSMPIRLGEDVTDGPIQRSVSELASQLRPVDYDRGGT
jgi:hypothetical protein